MSASDFKFPLTDLKDKGQIAVKASTGPGTFPDALSEGSLVGPVALTGTIIPADDEAAFTGTAKGKWKFECTRCLKPVEQAWSAQIEFMAPIEGGPLDLTEEVRQSIALAQPMKVLCRPDCQGLCETCRKNRNEVKCGHAQGGAGDGAPGGDFANTRKPRLTPRRHKG